MNDEQRKFLVSINLNPDGDEVEIIDAVADYLMQYCLDESYAPNGEGIICESILDYFGEK